MTGSNGFEKSKLNDKLKFESITAVSVERYPRGVEFSSQVEDELAVGPARQNEI